MFTPCIRCFVRNACQHAVTARYLFKKCSESDRRESYPSVPGKPQHAIDFKKALDEISPQGMRIPQNVVVCVSQLPYKCPPVGHEMACLVDDVLVRNGTRDFVNLIMSTPFGQATPAANSVPIQLAMDEIDCTTMYNKSVERLLVLTSLAKCVPRISTS